LRIENDTPFLVNYVLDFLNITRSNSGSTSLSTAIVGGASGGSGGGSSASGGSTSDIKATYESDLWKAIQSDINKIIGVEDLSPSSAPPLSSEATSQVKITTITSNYIAANPQAGIVGIFASNKQHQTIKSYLEKIKDSVSAQVLIEAKIVEIDLSDQYRSGVNWSSLMKKIKGGLAISQSLTFPKSSNAGTDSLTVLSPRGATDSPFLNGASRIQGSGSPGSLDTLVELSQQFGVTRTLSSPRLHAMNNQQAVLSFVTNQVYFSVSIENQADTTSSTGGITKGTLSVNSTSHTIPIGVILTLQPSINLDTEEITMNIRPTITNTDLDNGILDPAIEYIKTTVPTGTKTEALFSKIPVVDVKELDSILKIKSGEIMVIGGMMQDRTSDVHSGIPGLMSIPLLGNLFKTVNKINTTTQTVIFIQATIVPSNELSKKDRNFYNNFAIDKEVRI
jgi:MSHA type pilus biogenesis protein MshL